jgi:hypothetical protein
MFLRIELEWRQSFGEEPMNELLGAERRRVILLIEQAACRPLRIHDCD